MEDEIVIAAIFLIITVTFSRWHLKRCYRHDNRLHKARWDRHLERFRQAVPSDYYHPCFSGVPTAPGYEPPTKEQIEEFKDELENPLSKKEGLKILVHDLALIAESKGDYNILSRDAGFRKRNRTYIEEYPISQRLRGKALRDGGRMLIVVIAWLGLLFLLVG